MKHKAIIRARSAAQGSGAKQQKAMALQPVVLEETISLCPECLERVPAQKVAYGSRVYLEKNCPQHGSYKTLIWRGKPAYQDWRKSEVNDKPPFHQTESEFGCPYDCGICSQHKQDVCCVLLELTERCNQHCPFCFASSGETSGNPEMTLAQISALYDSILAKSPHHPYNIQLSGGEPTMREDLTEIIAMGKAKGFTYIQLNTNGKKLADSLAYAKELQKAGLDCAYLQFDGMRDEVYQKLRGEPLLAVKKQAVAHCAEAGIGVVLVVTLVPGVNIQEIGAIIDYALQHLPAVRGVSFQPVSYFGRFPTPPKDEMRFTIPEVLREIQQQTGGRMKKQDFLPLLSGDCYCSFHGNFVVMPDDSIVGISSDENRNCCCGGNINAITRAREYIADKFRANPKTVVGGCDFTSWDLFVKQVSARGLCITCEAFQDVWNFDVLRTQKCRLYVGTPEQKLVPFCVYHLTDVKGRFLYGGCR